MLPEPCLCVCDTTHDRKSLLGVGMCGTEGEGQWGLALGWISNALCTKPIYKNSNTFPLMLLSIVITGRLELSHIVRWGLVSDTAFLRILLQSLLAECNPQAVGVSLEKKKNTSEQQHLSPWRLKKDSWGSGSRFSSHFYPALKLLIKVMQDTLSSLHHLAWLLSDAEELAKLSLKNNVLRKMDLNGYIG